MVRNVLRPLARAARNTGFAWRYGLNLLPTLDYLSTRHALSGEADRVLASLNTQGIAVTSALSLLGTDSCYEGLKAAVEDLERHLAAPIAEARTQADDSQSVGQKRFIYHLLGDRPILEPTSVYTRFALQKPILEIANAYFLMYTQLRYYNVWHTFSTHSDARESQLWHRDREDYRVLKVFVYLSDVDDGAGPFTYAPGTHSKGSVRRDAKYSLEGQVRRSNDVEMAEVVPAERWLQGVGQAGTIIFADTRGYHKGGLGRQRDRIMYTCMFTSPASQVQDWFQRPEPISPPLRKEEALALAAPARKAY